MRRATANLLCLGLALACGGARADAAERLSEALKAMHSFSASFHQRVENEFGSMLEESEGIFHLQRPRALLWQTYAPFPVVVSTTDTHVRIYDQDLAQVTEMRLDELLAGTPAGIILTAGEQMTEMFEVTQRGVRDASAYTLTPAADDAEFVRVDMVFDHVGLAELDIEDALGNRTKVRFDDRRVNEPIADEAFEVIYPDGVDWLRQ
ncbi:MAG: outer-membrane lipoprotein carrier protein LolA [Gammaproteobacteria bacterium]|nr:outer-membrane lipoprotein carrier protein LolA [Gammaproteobacteria bacterium]